MTKPHTRSRWMTLLLPIALLTCCFQPALCQEPLVVFLVRHAEKVDAGKDPGLSRDGTQRAAALAKALRDADIKSVHSTDFIRTTKTASPVANTCGVKVDLYDVGDLPALVEQLKSNGGRHLVVGHSNTTPQLVELLGGKPGTKIQENEYDRLYVVTLGKDGTVSTVLIRYGNAFIPEAGH
jgi:probable phosphoglycerate mutase